MAIESLGAVGPLTMAFLKDLGRKIKLRTGEEKAYQYLLQQLSIVVQRGNCVSVKVLLEDWQSRVLCDFFLKCLFSCKLCAHGYVVL